MLGTIPGIVVTCSDPITTGNKLWDSNTGSIAIMYELFSIVILYTGKSTNSAAKAGSG